MSTEDNKRAVLRWREELWNKRNPGVVEELAAPDYIGHMAGIPGPVRGREALRQLFAGWLAAFDVRVTPEFLIAEGDMVAVRDANRAKHIGEFQGRPPTGQEVSGTSTDIYRIVDGRIVEQWFEADFTGMLLQLGLLPTTAHGAPTSTEGHTTFRRFSEEILTEERLDVADEIVATKPVPRLAEDDAREEA